MKKVSKKLALLATSIFFTLSLSAYAGGANEFSPQQGIPINYEIQSECTNACQHLKSTKAATIILKYVQFKTLPAGKFKPTKRKNNKMKIKLSNGKGSKLVTKATGAGEIVLDPTLKPPAKNTPPSQQIKGEGAKELTKGKYDKAWGNAKARKKNV